MELKGRITPCLCQFLPIIANRLWKRDRRGRKDKGYVEDRLFKELHVKVLYVMELLVEKLCVQKWCVKELLVEELCLKDWCVKVVYVKELSVKDVW